MPSFTPEQQRQIDSIPDSVVRRGVQSGEIALNDPALSRMIGNQFGKEELNNDWRLQNANYPINTLQNSSVERNAQLALGRSSNNPYSVARANQARGAQQALLAQLAQQQAGPSLASMQGARAQGQSLRAGLAGGPQTMGQVSQAGAQVANDTALAALGEQMRMSAGRGQLGGSLRAQDIGVAGDYTQAGLKGRSLDNAMTQHYTGQIQAMREAARREALEQEKLRRRLDVERGAAFDKDIDRAVQTASTVIGAVL